MSLYVLVGPDGKVYERTAAISARYVWENAALDAAAVKGIPKLKWGAIDKRKARRLGWRVRKCHIVLEEE